MSRTYGGWRASGHVKRAIRRGDLKEPKEFKCADCAAPATEYDHRDYNKPLDVEPVCQSCNTKRGPAMPWDGIRFPQRPNKQGPRQFRASGLPPFVERYKRGYRAGFRYKHRKYRTRTVKDPAIAHAEAMCLRQQIIK